MTVPKPWRPPPDTTRRIAPPPKGAPRPQRAAADTLGRRRKAAEPVAVDSTGQPLVPWYRKPKYIMFRSILVPGWGQWANHKHVKALVVAAGEGYLIFRAFDWARVERDYRRFARESADNLALQNYYLYAANNANSHRRDFTWWTIFATVLSMGDAYVDAQLGNKFDSQFKPQEKSFRGGGSPPAKGVPLRPGNSGSVLLSRLALRIDMDPPLAQRIGPNVAASRPPGLRVGLSLRVP